MYSLEPNALFAGRYRIARCIAAGGMGAVYEVVHIETERRRALKVMHAHFVQSAELRDRFKLEAKAAAQIDSEFIVDVFDAGVDEATQMPFLVMELLKGEELGKRLERVGRFAPPEAITYLWQTALALDKTHKANIVHRDLKPENLFLTQREDGPPRVKVLDFGVAKFVAETGTQGGATRSLGTPLYMSPEQFQSKRVTSASDNFALALMAYTLLVGEPYWSAEASGEVNVIGFAMKAAVGPIESATIRAGRCGVALPASFDVWFFQATSCDPAVRHSSATALISALGEVFGLSPARLTGVGSSHPLPAPNGAPTQPLRSGVGQSGGFAASSAPGQQAASVPVGGRASHPPAPPHPPGNMQATVAAVAYAQPAAKKASTLPLALVGGLMLAGSVGGGAVYLLHPGAKAGYRSDVSNAQPAAALATGDTSAAAKAVPSESRSSALTAAATGATIASAESGAAPSASVAIASATEPHSDARTPRAPGPPVRVASPPAKPPTPPTMPLTRPGSSGPGYSQD